MEMDTQDAVIIQKIIARRNGVRLTRSEAGRMAVIFSVSTKRSAPENRTPIVGPIIVFIT